MGNSGERGEDKVYIYTQIDLLKLEAARLKYNEFGREVIEIETGESKLRVTDNKDHCYLPLWTAEKAMYEQWDFVVSRNQTKVERDRKERGVILGNAKYVTGQFKKKPAYTNKPPKPASDADDMVY